MNEIKTGRALQLEGLQHARNKVTLGFKCDAGTKIQLAQEAQQHGMTLSEYVDTLISSRHNQQQSSSSVAQQNEYNRTLSQQADNIQLLERKVAFYENDFMKKAFESYKGQTLMYKDSMGHSRTITIKRIEDVFTVMYNTVTVE